MGEGTRVESSHVEVRSMAVTHSNVSFSYPRRAKRNVLIFVCQCSSHIIQGKKKIVKKGMHHTTSLVPRPLPDFISQLWRKRLQNKIWEWPGKKAREGLGMRLGKVWE